METALNNPKVSFEDFYEVPDLKFDIDRLRKDLDLILCDLIRELADAAQIKHGRIIKLPTLRQRLTERFADMLPDQDE